MDELTTGQKTQKETSRNGQEKGQQTKVQKEAMIEETINCEFVINTEMLK